MHSFNGKKFGTPGYVANFENNKRNLKILDESPRYTNAELLLH